MIPRFLIKKFCESVMDDLAMVLAFFAGAVAVISCGFTMSETFQLVYLFVLITVFVHGITTYIYYRRYLDIIAPGGGKYCP